jgi:hypothetical protein
MDANWAQAIGDLGNRKGLALLLLATRILAVGPLLIFLLDRQLFLDLPTAKLMLLVCAVTLPSMLLATPTIIFFSDERDRDSRVVQSLVLPSGVLVFADLVSCALVYWQDWGVKAVIGFQFVAIIMMLLDALPDYYRRRRALVAEPIDASPEELRAFAETRRKQFAAWLEMNRNAT